MGTVDSGPRLPTGRDWAASEVVEADFDLPMHVGAATYQKLPYVPDPDELRRGSVDVAIVGAAVDEGDTNRPGARFGPRAIRLAQSNTGSIYSQSVGLRPFEVLSVVDAGDAQVTPTQLGANHHAVYRKLRGIARAGTVPIMLGGDHSISWPAVTALAEWHWPRRIGLLHFDAHPDTSTGPAGVSCPAPVGRLSPRRADAERSHRRAGHRAQRRLLRTARPRYEVGG